MQLFGVAGWGSAIAAGLLAMADVDYDYVDIEGFDEPGPAQERLAALNPLKQVPTLVLDDGQVMTETAAIALWLADRAPGLAPAADDPDRARFLRLLVWLVANVYPTFTYGDYPERWAPADPEGLRETTNAYRRRLYEWLEGQIIGPFVLGEKPCALDIYLAVMIAWRPRDDWFKARTPKLFAAAMAARNLPRVNEAMAANGLSA